MKYARLLICAIWLFPAGWSAVIFFLLTRKIDRFIPDWFPPYGLTAMHVIVFAILAILLYIAFKSGSSITMGWGVCVSFLYASIYGTVIEWYQYHIPWRTGDWGDVAANIAGAATVFLLALSDRRWHLFPRLWRPSDIHRGDRAASRNGSAGASPSRFNE